MKSKALIGVQRALTVISSIGCLIAILYLPTHSPVRLCSIGGLVLSTLWSIINTRCPHCGRFGAIKPKLTAKDAGVCVHCHELVEYR